MIHGPSLYNNLYKIPPYLNIFTERNPMSLTRFRSQSHQLIPTHKFTIQNAQRVTYDQRLFPYCDQQATGTEILFYSNAQALNTLPTKLSSPLPHYSHTATSQHGTPSHCVNKRPSCLQTPPQLSPKFFTKRGCTLPPPTFSHT